MVFVLLAQLNPPFEMQLHKIPPSMGPSVKNRWRGFAFTELLLVGCNQDLIISNLNQTLKAGGF
jgi:hypothetical protein